MAKRKGLLCNTDLIQQCDPFPSLLAALPPPPPPSFPSQDCFHPFPSPTPFSPQFPPLSPPTPTQHPNPAAGEGFQSPAAGPPLISLISSPGTVGRCGTPWGAPSCPLHPTRPHPIPPQPGAPRGDAGAGLRPAAAPRLGLSLPLAGTRQDGAGLPGGVLGGEIPARVVELIPKDSLSGHREIPAFWG